MWQAESEVQSAVWVQSEDRENHGKGLPTERRLERWH